MENTQENSNMLVIMPEYRKMSLDSLLFMFEQFTAKDKGQRDALFDAIIVRYFELRGTDSSFNLYDYINRMRLRTNVFGVISRVLSIEFSNSTLQSLPKEHHEAFMSVLLELISFIEKKEEESNGEFSMEWDFTSTPALLQLLKSIDNSNIKNNVLKQRINLLSKRVEDSYNAKLQQQKDKEKEVPSDTALQVVKSSTDIAEVVEIKRLTVAKSKLTKGQVEEILRSIELYSEEDAEAIINLALKKWDEAILSLTPLRAYMYFKEHKVQQKFVNPLRSVSTFMAKERYNGNSQKLLNQVGFNSFAELINDAEKWYMTLDGATQEGCNHFIANLHHNKIKDNFTKEEYHSECVMQYMNEVVLQPALEVLREYKGQDIGDIALQKIRVLKKNLKPLDMGVSDIVMVRDGNYVIREPLLNEEVSISVLDYTISILKILRGVLFEYDGTFLANSDELKVYSSKYEESAEELIAILNSYRLTGEGLKKVKAVDNGYQSPLQQSMLYAIKNYFCNNEITAEISRDLIGSKETYEAFARFTDSRSNQGSYHDKTSFLYECLATIIDEFDFSRAEDRELFFTYDVYTNNVDKKIVVHKKKEYGFSVYSKVMSKLKNEVPEVVNILKRYADLVGKEKEVLAFLSIYFCIKKK